MLATVLPSHTGDDVAGATWPRRDVDAESCWRRRCWGNLAVARCRCRVMLVIMLSSHAGNSAAGATWLQRDVDAESC
jgi:hypothetical protein